jgi:hypothetical protein
MVLLLLLLLLERIQQKFVPLCFYRFFPHAHCSYAYALEQLELPTLPKRGYHLDVLLRIQVYPGYEFCPSFLETVGPRIPARYIRAFSLSGVCFPC